MLVEYILLVGVGLAFGLALSYFKLLKGLKGYEEERLAKMERKYRVAKMKIQFFKEFSHKFVTPLYGISGFSEQLLDTNLDPDQREMVKMIQVTSEELRVALAGIIEIQEQKKAPENPNTRTFSLAGLDVLIAEDNEVSQKVTSRYLQKVGINVDVVNCGQMAIERANQKPYHIILMDLEMPGIDGLAATREIRKLRNSTSQTIIIGFSAHTSPEVRKNCIEAGMNDFLTKPASASDILGTLRSWASHHSPRIINNDLPAASGTSVSLENLPIFRELGDDQEALSDVVQKYLKSCPNMLSEVENAILSSDSQKLGQSAHLLKGSLAHFFQKDSLKLVEDLEKRAASKDWNGILSVYSDLRSRVEKTNSELKKSVAA